MQPARINELLQPFLLVSASRRLTEKDLQDISTYIDILQRWNARVNLTGIRSEEEIVTRHFGESFFAAAHMFPTSDGQARLKNPAAPAVVDVGSGAGFPGIPIKLWAPEVSLTLIEANHKKATFLREVTRSLALTGVNIQNTRAENVETEFDLVTLRAVEQFETILPIAASLLAPSALISLLISTAQLPKALSTPKVVWRPPIPLPQSTSRVLLVGEGEHR